MGIAMIKTMHAPTEMVFDDYLDEFRDLLAVFTRVIQRSKRTSRANVRFGLDSGFISLLFLAARICRNPSLRRQLIAALATANRAEHGYGAQTAAATAHAIQILEESDIHPPPAACGDVPAQNRLRLVSFGFYFHLKAMRIQFVRPPYHFTPGDIEEIWIPHLIAKTQIHYATFPHADGLQPDCVLGRGFTSYRIADEPSRHYTISRCRFHFSIPRV